MPNAVVTGSNRGIGLELCRQLKEKGWHVVAACRTSGPDLDALGVEVQTGVDVTDDGSVDMFVARLAGRPVHLLLHNAGVLERESPGEVDDEAMHDQYEVNAVGPLRLTRALLPNLPEGAKVGFVSSRLGSISEAGAGYYGYRMSKAALNMAAAVLAQELRPKGVAVAVLHPGYVKTRMTGFRGEVEPAQAAAGLVARMDELTTETSGRFWDTDGREIRW